MQDEIKFQGVFLVTSKIICLFLMIRSTLKDTFRNQPFSFSLRLFNLALCPTLSSPILIRISKRKTYLVITDALLQVSQAATCSRVDCRSTVRKLGSRRRFTKLLKKVLLTSLSLDRPWLWMMSDTILFLDFLTARLPSSRPLKLLSWNSPTPLIWNLGSLNLW